MGTQDDVKSYMEANPTATLKEIMEGAGVSKPTAVAGRTAWMAERDGPGEGEGKAQDAEGQEKTLQEAYPPAKATEPKPNPTKEEVDDARPRTVILTFFRRTRN